MRRSFAKRPNPYFTRQWSSEFSTGYLAATNNASDTVIFSFEDALGGAAGTTKMAKAISIVGWTYYTDYQVSNAGTANTTIVVREALVQDSSKVDVSEHVALVYLQGTQMLAASVISGFPDRVLHRRLGSLPASPAGTTLMTSVPVWGLQQSGRRPIHMKPQDVIYWHTEVDVFGGTNATVHQILFGTVTYKVVT